MRFYLEETTIEREKRWEQSKNARRQAYDISCEIVRMMKERGHSSCVLSYVVDMLPLFIESQSPVFRDVKYESIR